MLQVLIKGAFIFLLITGFGRVLSFLGKKENTITLTVTVSYNVRQSIWTKVNKSIKMEQSQKIVITTFA